ncbi:MAG: type IV-A pilus assembly ATPase PilB [Acidobacteria bacterium]|nr:type IV-A pilus assembly ATPase PilB [Acidobacteriota bacterium]
MAARIGELLVETGGATQAGVDEALEGQRSAGGRLGSHLVGLGLARDADVAAVLSRQFSVPFIELGRFDVEPAAVALLPAATARKYETVPLGRTGAALAVAMSDPANVFAVDDIEFMTGCRVEPVVATQAAIRAAVERYYGEGPSRSGADLGESRLALAAKALEEVPGLGRGLEVIEEAEEVDVTALETQSDKGPVVRLVNAVLASAIQKGASDVHFEPYEKRYRIRFRIDGVLYEVMEPPPKYRDTITSRLKVMAKLDIAERRLPQDGRIKLRLNADGAARDIDFRVSCLPTLQGEKIVLRLLDRGKLMLDMTRLGLEAESLKRLEEAIRRPWGLVLVTGPTGSGKTSTLYSAISRLNTPAANIMTAEDPVEFNLAGVNQVQTRDSTGLTFAVALRSFLRQDPNVILVGEIRDLETAEIAIKAALTGHLVLSTLHTNDAAGTIHRLVNMGIEPFLVAGAVSLVCAQRLVRRICTGCAEDEPTPPPVLEATGFGADEAARVVPRRGAGCERCNGRGYRGRIGLYEVMAVTERFGDMVRGGASTAELRRHAVEGGMVTLRASGLRKIAAGLTSIEEVLKET